MNNGRKTKKRNKDKGLRVSDTRSQNQSKNLKKFGKYLKEIYYNPKNPAAYSSLDKLYRYIQTEGKHKISKNILRQWLQGQETYTVHREVKSNFARRKVISPYVDYMWQTDLSDYRNYAQKFNNGYCYFIVVIDTMSRFIWTKPLKSKKTIEVARAFEHILDSSGRKPYCLNFDKGKEFTGDKFASLLKERGIKGFVTQNTPKSSLAERCLKTIKTKLALYMTNKQTYKWYDVLPDITESYNNTYHRSIKRTPASVTKEDSVELWKLQYDHVVPQLEQYQFEIGDKVRISYLRNTFQRQYDEKWSREVFEIYKREMKQGLAQYSLRDLLGEQIVGKFYQSQLLKIRYTGKETYLIEKVLATRIRGGKEESLIKWLSWDSRYNSWIPSKDIKSFT